MSDKILLKKIKIVNGLRSDKFVTRVAKELSNDTDVIVKTDKDGTIRVIPLDIKASERF